MAAWVQTILVRGPSTTSPTRMFFKSYSRALKTGKKEKEKKKQRLSIHPPFLREVRACRSTSTQSRRPTQSPTRAPENFRV